MCSEALTCRAFSYCAGGLTYMWGGQGRDLEHQCVSSSLSLSLSTVGCLSDMNEVSIQYAALQVSVRLESAKASLILKIEPAGRQ